MLQSLIALALRLRVPVIAASVGVLVAGLLALRRVRLDVLPDFAPPQAVVQTEAPGFSPEQVERLVTLPVETAVAGAGGLEALRSQSIQGLSIVTAVFADDADPWRARQSLAERLAELGAALPAGVRTPKLAPLTSATMDLLKVGLVSDARTLAEIRRFAQWTLRPRLLAVPGVAGVSLFGGDVERIEIEVAPERMAALGFALHDVVGAAREATGIRAGGFVETDAQRVILETHGAFDAPAQLERVVLGTRGGRIVTLGDVARVTLGSEPKFGDALIQGRPGVLVTALSQYGANTMDVTKRVEAALADLAPTLAAERIEVLDRLHRPATFIESSLANLRRSLVLGAVLVAIVLVLALGDLRTALISLAAIPLSLLTAVIVLHAFGATLNTITLGGLAIALGEVVDDAIIDVENIHRRLRENASLERPRAAAAVVLAASLEVRRAVVFATATVALVFVPVLTLSGLQGRMFAPLAVAYLLAIGASLAVALVVTPALALASLPRAAARARPPRLMSLARERYVRLLGFVVRRPGRALVLPVVLLAVACALAPRFGFEFLPKFREGHFVLHASMAPGTSLVEMKRVGAKISRDLLDTGFVATVEQQIGRAELGEDPWGPNRSEFHVELEPTDADGEERAESAIRAVLAGTPGIRSDVLTFLGDRIGETISGETAAIAVGVVGGELDVLEATAARVAEVMRAVPGAVDVQTSAVPALPTYEVDLDPERLARLAVRPVPVLEAIEIAFQGATVAQAWDGNRVRDVSVALDPAARAKPEAAAEILVRSDTGALVPLSAVADLHPSAGRAAIAHSGGVRRASATCNVEGRDASSFEADLRASLARDVRLSPGVSLDVGGAARAEAEARIELLTRAGLALAAIVLLLWMAFESWRTLALLFLNLPFALVGGVIAAWIAGGSLTLGSLVGFVTLFGITTRNSIMLLSHYEHLVREEGQEWNAATALRGASERFGPIVMTALVTGLGLLPLALQSGAAGREIEGPMAAVIVGGLTTSTLLNLLVLPSLASKFGRFGRTADAT